MAFCAVTLQDLLADFDLTAAKWKQFFAKHPVAAKVPTDIVGSGTAGNAAGTVGALAWHLYLASVVHAQRLLDEPITRLTLSTPVENMAEVWDMYAQGSAKLHQFLVSTSDQALDTVIPVLTHLGTEVEMTRRKLCMHIFIHAIRHWAQIGPLVRQHGFTPDWPQDISFSPAIH
jgi:uncharacterized damage-inducible protein DinB